MATLSSANFTTYTDQIAAQIDTYDSVLGTGIDGVGAPIVPVTASDGAVGNIDRIIANADHEVVNDLIEGFRAQFNAVITNPLAIQYAISGLKALSNHVGGIDAFLTTNAIRLAPQVKEMVERIIGGSITAANTYPPVFDKMGDCAVTALNTGAITNLVRSDNMLYKGYSLFSVKTTIVAGADPITFNLTCYSNIGTETIAIYHDASDAQGIWKPVLSNHVTLTNDGVAAMSAGAAVISPYTDDSYNFYLEKTSALAGAEALAISLTCTLPAGTTETKIVSVNASDPIGTLYLIGTHPDNEYTAVTLLSCDVAIPAAANTWKIGFTNKFYNVDLASTVAAGASAGENWELGNSVALVEATAVDTAVLSGGQQIDDTKYNGSNFELEKLTVAAAAAGTSITFTCTLADGTTEEKVVLVDASDALGVQVAIGTHVADKYIKVAISTITPPVLLAGIVGELWKVVANQERTPVL